MTGAQLSGSHTRKVSEVGLLTSRLSCVGLRQAYRAVDREAMLAQFRNNIASQTIPAEFVTTRFYWCDVFQRDVFKANSTMESEKAR